MCQIDLIKNNSFFEFYVIKKTHILFLSDIGYFSGNPSQNQPRIVGINYFFPECGPGAQKILGEMFYPGVNVMNLGAAAADAGPAQGTRIC